MDKNRLLSLSLFMTSLIFVYFYGGVVPYMLFYITILLPCISLLYTLVVFTRFKFRQEIDRHFVTKGERVSFKYSIHNEDYLFYPYIKVKFCNSDMIFTDQFQEKRMSLLPATSKSFSFDLDCHYRGSYTIGIEYIDIEDFTGVFRFRYKIKNRYNITVSPKIINLDRFFINTSFISEAHSNLNTAHEDYTTISDIRKYSYGDSSRRIHWKATSRLGKLMVKNFQSTTESSAVVLLDLSLLGLTPSQNIIVEDKIIESVVSVVNYCLKNWIQIDLLYYNNGIKSMEAKMPSDFSILYDFLSNAEFKETVNLPDMLKIHVNKNMTGTNLIIFTSKLTYDTYSEICNAKLAGHEPSLVFISPEELTETSYPQQDRILTSLSDSGIKFYKINISDDIKNVLERCI